MNKRRDFAQKSSFFNGIKALTKNRHSGVYAVRDADIRNSRRADAGGLFAFFFWKRKKEKIVFSERKQSNGSAFLWI